jgi:hypothetical protein
MLSQGHLSAPLNSSPAKLAPDLGILNRLWSRNDAINIMFEADIYLRPVPTSILDIYKVFEPLECCLKGIWVHPYTIPPAKLAPNLRILGHSLSIEE